MSWETVKIAHGARVEARGLSDDHSPELHLRCLCIGCGALIYARNLTPLVALRTDAGLLRMGVDDVRMVFDHQEACEKARGLVGSKAQG